MQNRHHIWNNLVPCRLSKFLGSNDTGFCNKNATCKGNLKRRTQMGKGRAKSFENIKNELCANPPVQPYSLTWEATVTTDATENAIGGVFSQQGHPVIYVSKKLSQTEQNYSNIEQEALEIVLVVTRLKLFLLGRRFTLQTDHKPLKYLFAPDEKNPKIASARITRWAIALMGFWLRIEIYTRGTDPPRWCSEQTRLWRRRWHWSSLLCSWQYLLRPFRHGDPVRHKTELGSNRLFQDVIKRIKSGIWKQCSEAERGFEQQKDALTFHNGITFRGVVPLFHPN